jgi:hypothetical protein
VPLVLAARRPAVDFPAARRHLGRLPSPLAAEGQGGGARPEEL